MNIFKKIIFILLGIYLFSAFLLYINQRSILYIPSSPVKTSFQEVYFNNNGVKIKIFVANPKKKDALIYFGGNAENVIYSFSAFASKFSNHALYFVNYRGYGGSSGEPTEEGIYSDALFIYDQLKQKHKNINIIGRSLGSAVATYVASKRKVDRLVLVTPFDSILSVAQEKYPIYPMQILLKDTYNSIENVSRITAKKTLILRAEEDKTITAIHTTTLSDAFRPLSLTTKYFYKKGHHTIIQGERYFSEIKKFIQNKYENLECAYYSKPKPNEEYGNIETFKDCGTLIGDTLTLKEEHIKNIGFQKGREAQHELNTIYSGVGFFNVTREGKALKMYIFDNGTDYYREGLARYISNNKIGFTDTKLNIIIPAKYDYALAFENGFAIVSNGCHKERSFPQDEHSSVVGGLWGAIDKNGTLVVPIKYKFESEVKKILRSI